MTVPTGQIGSARSQLANIVLGLIGARRGLARLVSFFPSLRVILKWSTPLMNILPGTSLTVTALIYDQTGLLYDPDVLNATHWDHAARTMTAIPVSRMGQGQYQVSVIPLSVGTHVVRLEGDTANPFRVEEAFPVQSPAF